MNLLSIQPLNRIAIQFGPLTVYWYGIIIGIGILLGLILAIREGKKLQVPSNTFTDLVLYALPISILSARIYYVLFEWAYYKDHLNEVFAIWNGGIAIHGGLIGAIVTTIVFTKKRNISFWKLADIAAPSLILGQAIGRWGNFMNQEAHGGPVSRTFLESLRLPDTIINQMYINGSYYHPTFLYESIWNIIGFCTLLILRKGSLKRGEIFLSYLIWYSIGRFFVEGLRTDSLMLTSSLRMAQVMSISLIIISLLLMIYRRRKALATTRYNEQNNNA
ncbi:prolipoprotein diacylglyceryl transferase [Bacillus cereus]|uniref:prolipoprotein diacylglyceryl transferase n=1 Tax=Bacillus cereus TaxID=1396 RepID=UPI0024067AC0|nr:prolipoprotein diacylglyceryl transferase [Bacillus cereus]MDF9478954.1 prolipoprotein diacylglyceryl transferase [Bacillus cereus]MDF9500533.1 prolipoprotein diacylglyceryl transferase [Bacillus cereus]MDF9517596.1 prolipoprotein diacylglyceryl transferase [Bacillus cereus]MDF9569674.1 prolipoprotein diacylglyceryl transferase [Bacillus cereus]